MVDEEFEYHVHVKAREAFINSLRNDGILLPQTENEDFTFTSEKLLDMKSYKQRGLIWSYITARLRKTKEIIDQG